MTMHRGAENLEAATTRRYAAFFSYSHADEAFAKWLHKKIECYRVPPMLLNDGCKIPQRLGKVFRDRVELSAATDLGAAIAEALDASDTLIVLCSPRAR